MKISSFPVFVLLGSAPLLPASAAASETAGLSHACANIVQPADRLACYDEAFPPVVASESGEEQALRDFGLDRKQVRERQPERLREAKPERIEAEVSAVVYRANGGRVVTLDNGQVWVLTEGTSKGPLKSGDRVTIRSAALGSFMLLTPARVPLRARRID